MKLGLEGDFAKGRTLPTGQMTPKDRGEEPVFISTLCHLLPHVILVGRCCPPKYTRRGGWRSRCLESSSCWCSKPESYEAAAAHVSEGAGTVRKC